MGIGQFIKKGFTVAKTSMNLVVVLFVFGLVWNLINLGLSSRIPAEGQPDPATSVMMVIAGTIFVFLTIFFQSGSLGYVKEHIKAGKASLAQFREAGGRYYVSILAVASVVTLIIGVFVMLAALSAGLLNDKLQVVGVILAILLAALGLSFVVLLFLAPYIVVAENSKAGEAIRQSAALVKKNIGALLGVSLLLVAIGFGIGMILGGVFAGLALVIKGMVSQIIFAVLSSAVNAYLGVVVTAAFMTFYLSLPKTTANHN